MTGWFPWKGAISGRRLSTLTEVALALFVTAGWYKAGLRQRVVFFQYADATALLGIILGLCVLARLRSSRPWARWDRGFVLAFLLFCGLMVASLLYTPALSYGLSKTARFLSLTALAIFAPMALLDSRRSMTAFLLSLVGIGFLFGLAAVLTAWRMTEPKAVRVFGSNCLSLGRMSGITVLIAALFLMRHRQRPGQLISVIVAALAGYALLLSAGRGPLFALIITPFLLIPLALGVARRNTLVYLAGFGIMLVIAFAVLEFVGLVPPALNLRLAYLVQPLQPEAQIEEAHVEEAHVDLDLGVSANRRILLLSEAGKTIRERPIFGLGVGGFAAWSEEVARWRYPHNFILEVGAELGIVGVGLLFVIFVSTLSVWRRGLKYDGPVGRSMLVTAMAHLVFNGLNALWSGDLNDNRIMWMSLGLVQAASIVSRYASASLEDD